MMHNQVLLYCILLVCSYVYIVNGDKQWALSAGGSWSKGENWLPAGVPGLEDDVYITNNGNYQVTLDTQTSIKALYLGGTTGQQSLALQGAVLSVSNGGIIGQTGVLDIASGTIEGGNELVVEGVAKFHDLSTKIISSIKFTIHGNMTLDAGGLQLEDSAQLIIGTDGQLVVTSLVGIVNSDKTAALVVNQGTIIVEPGVESNYETTLSAKIVNSGSVKVELGKLQLYNDGEWLGSLEVADNAEVEAFAGNHTFGSTSVISGNGTFYVSNSAITDLRGDVQIEYFDVDGGGAAVFANSDVGITFKQFSLKNGQLGGQNAIIEVFTWEGGSLLITNVYVNHLQVFGTLARSITTTNLIIGETANFANATNIILYEYSSVIIAKDAVMLLDTQVHFLCGNDTSSIVKIEGELHIDYASEIQFTCATLVEASGTLYAQQGSLSLQAPFELYGNLSISDGAHVDLTDSGPAHVGSAIFGDGYISCLACHLEIFGSVNIGSVIFTGGSIKFQQDKSATPYFPHVRVFNQSGSSTLEFSNNADVELNLIVDYFYFTGGTITSNLDSLLGVRSSLVILGEAKFSGDDPLLVQNLAFVNYGVTVFSGTHSTELYGRNFFTNAENATWSIQGKVSITKQDQSQAAYSSRFDNYGVFEAGVASQVSLTLFFNNFGSVTVQNQGALAFVQSEYIQDKCSAQTVLFGGTLSSQIPINILNGRIIGFGKVDGDLLLKGDIIATTEISDVPVDPNTPLRITGILTQRTPGLIGVALLASDDGVVTLGGLLVIEKTYQLWGGSLAIQPTEDTDAAPIADLVFATYADKVGVATYDDVQGATINSTYGYSVSVGSSSILLELVPAPAVSQIKPDSGPTSGGTLVTISGSHFVKSDTLQVLFGDSVASVAGWSGPDLVVSAPAGSGTKQTVCVSINFIGCSDDQQSPVFWDYLPPTIAEISPKNSSRPTTGGNVITITGSNFGSNPEVVAVTIGNLTCAVASISDDSVSCVAPKGVGSNNPLVVDVSGQQVTSTYSYDGPIISSITPTSGHVRGGERLVVFGQNFGDDVNVVEVTIDTHTCSNLTRVQTSFDGNSIFSCSTPALAKTKVSVVDVVVVVAGQKSAPAKFSAEPDSGSGGGGGKSLSHQDWWVYLVFAVVLLVFFALGFLLHVYITRRGYERIN